MGRAHRPFYRIVATDSRRPRDGKYIEELGSYNPMIREKDERVRLKAGRVKYWLGVGALPTEKVEVLLKKYLEKWEKIETEGGGESSETPPAESTESPEQPTSSPEAPEEQPPAE